MILKKHIALTALALAASVSTTSAQSNLWSDNFSNPTGWHIANGQISYANQQFVISRTYGPTPTNSVESTLAWAWLPIPNPGPLPEHQTLEVRVDLVSANQDDAWASLAFLDMEDDPGRAYHFFKDQDEVALLTGSSTWFAFFFYEKLPLKNQNVTMVLSLTRLGSDLRITTRVLDKDNTNAVLFERTVTDTPQADLALPSGTVRGCASGSDQPGTPWPIVSAPANVLLGMGWVSPLSSSVGAAQVTYDNLEVWQYESPQLAIQKAVVLSWPVTQGPFVPESAPSVNGTWTQVSSPWWRTNAGTNEVMILTPGSMELFRLRRLGP
jgi:hypothetical protein